MVYISIVEDDDAYGDILQDYIVQYGKETETEFHVSRYRNGADFLEHYSTQTDIVLMDIDLPVLDGMTAAESLRKLDSLVVLIFVTNLAQYAIQGYSVDAMDYVIKPIRYSHFAIKMDKAIRNLPSREDWYVIPGKDGLLRIATSRIYYLESSGHQILFHTAEGVFPVRGTLKSMEERMRGRGFSRPNNSFLVNLHHVQTIRADQIVVHGKEFTIGRSRKQSFLDDLNAYLGGRVIRG